MRQLTFVEPGRLEWWDVDAPRLADDREALVRPVAVATCDLDAMLVRGRTPYQPPVAFGHECVAEVIEGEGQGTLVSVPFQVSCGDCDACARGNTGNCTAVPRLSMFGFGAFGGDWGGFMSDLVRVPYADHMLVPLPEGVDPAAAASVSDNVTDAWRTVGPHLDERPASAVLVVGGAGSIGVYAAGIAAALGAETVNYLDSDEDRLEKARAMGANAIEGPYPGRAGPTRSPSTRAPTAPGSPARCGPPSRTGSAPAPASTSSPRRRCRCSRPTQTASPSIPAESMPAPVSRGCWS